MEPTVIIALISGVVSIIGISLNVVGQLRKSASDRTVADSTTNEQRNNRIDDKYDKYIQMVEAREHAALQRLDAAEEKWSEERGELQAKYQEAISRIETMGTELQRAQQMIQQQNDKIERLEAAS